MSSSGGYWLRRSSASWPARFLSMLCFIALLTLALPSYAAEPNDLISSLQTRLLSIKTQLTELEGELGIWKLLSQENALRAQELLTELETLKTELGTWQTASAQSQNQVEALKTSLDASERKLTELSKIWLDSANSWKAVADRERLVVRRWKFGAIIAGAGALLLGGLTGYLLGK